jgi:hypothetical protein
MASGQTKRPQRAGRAEADGELRDSALHPGFIITDCSGSPRRVRAGCSEMKLPFFRRLIWLIPPYLAPTNETMRTFVGVFVLALITIAFEVYSDATLRSAEIPHAAPDPASVAIAHGPKGGWVREGFASSGRGEAP